MLILDAATAELFPRLEQAGVRALLLKGPSVARWLYANEGERGYSDIDVLLSPEQLRSAGEVLRALGYKRVHTFRSEEGWLRRRDQVVVDVHTSLVGVEAGESDAWRLLSERSEPLTVAEVDVEVLAPDARALHIAMHALAHGSRERKPLADLERALRLLPADTWDEAAALAQRLDAVPAFAAGLRLLPDGAAQAARLRLPDRRSLEVALREGTAPPLSVRLYALLRTPGVSAKAELLAHGLLPSPTVMRARFRLARRGRLGLALAYFWRPVWLLWRLGPAVRALSRARARARDVDLRSAGVEDEDAGVGRE